MASQRKGSGKEKPPQPLHRFEGHGTQPILEVSIMNTRIVTTRTAAQQAAQAAVIAYRAGFHQEAAILWRAAVSAYMEQMK